MMIAVRLLSAAALAFVLSHAWAQAPAKPLAFDVISIKPDNGSTTLTGQSVNGQAVVSMRIMIHTPPDGFSGSNLNAKTLIGIAYGIKDDLIVGGPDWISTAAYDIDAKALTFDPPETHQLTREQRNQMLQALLADRFHLAAHNETKEAPIYELVLAKGGSKLKESDPSSTPQPPPGAVMRSSGAAPMGMFRMMPGQFSANGVSTTQFADNLSRQVHRTVVDKTGLTGKYDITLHYTPDNGPAADSDTSGPSIFTALEEQLGLKLVSTKGPVKTLVIDHIEKPSEN